MDRLIKGWGTHGYFLSKRHGGEKVRWDFFPEVKTPIFKRIKSGILRFFRLDS